MKIKQMKRNEYSCDSCGKMNVAMFLLPIRGLQRSKTLRCKECASKHVYRIEEIEEIYIPPKQ